jgi:hypothetical protein
MQGVGIYDKTWGVLFDTFIPLALAGALGQRQEMPSDQDARGFDIAPKPFYNKLWLPKYMESKAFSKFELMCIEQTGGEYVSTKHLVKPGDRGVIDQKLRLQDCG